MIFSTYLSQPVLFSLIVSLLAVLYLIIFYRRYITRVCRLKKIQDAFLPVRENLPDLSIIIYCRDNADQLRNALQAIFSQDYPAKFELIVVNDGSSEDTKDIVNLFSAHHRNLYQTFIPADAHSLSHRKLAITLGIKAARYEYVIFTNADAVIRSHNWLIRMAEPFTKGKEVVIGHASCIDGIDRQSGAMMRRFDNMADATAYLGSACGKRPYRCNNYNVGYRKDLFFRNKGFSSSLNLHNGDDDIFISEIATAGNTQVVVSEESQIRCDFYNPKKLHRESKTNHIFTGRFTTKRARLIMATGSWAIWIWLVSTVLTFILSYPDYFAWILSGVIASVMWLIMSLTWKRVSNTLNEPINPWLSVLMMLYRPVYNFYFRLRSRFGRSKNYTWMKIK